MTTTTTYPDTYQYFLNKPCRHALRDALLHYIGTEGRRQLDEATAANDGKPDVQRSYGVRRRTLVLYLPDEARQEWERVCPNLHCDHERNIMLRGHDVQKAVENQLGWLLRANLIDNVTPFRNKALYQHHAISAELDMEADDQQRDRVQLALEKHGGREFMLDDMRGMLAKLDDAEFVAAYTELSKRYDRNRG